MGHGWLLSASLTEGLLAGVLSWNGTQSTAVQCWAIASKQRYGAKGFATEAASALLSWAFDTLDLNRVHSQADTRNIASGRVLEKLGFVLKGTLREDCIVDGEVSDSWVYGLLRRDWNVLHSKKE